MSATPAREASHPRAGRLASAALLLSASFLLSRLLGVARTVVIADVFGDTRPIEAYFTAFRIPATIFTLVSGGALAAAFIPVFAGLTETDREDEAWDVAGTVITTLSLVLAGLGLLGFILAPVVMGLLLHAGSSTPLGLTVDLTRIMLLQPIFLGIGGILAAMLQTYHRFLLTAVAPLAYNVAVIAGGLLGHTYGTVGLAWSVVIGALAQVVILLPAARRGTGLRLRPALDWTSAGAREIVRLFLPRVVGLAAFQAMLFITIYLAWGLPRGMVGAVNYSWLLISFPVGAVGTAAATAIFPTLSRMSSVEDQAALRRTVNRSLRFVLFMSLPASAGLVVLRRPIINLLFLHGTVWTHRDTELTAFALLFYALATAPLASIEILPRVFYAMRDTYTPARIAVVAVAVDAVLSVLFVHLLPPSSGQGGLALATVIASALQMTWLALALDGRLEGIGLPSLLLTLRDAALARGAMAVAVYVLLDPLSAILPQSGIGVFVTVVFEIAVGGGVFAGVAYLLGAPELWELRGLAQRK